MGVRVRAQNYQEIANKQPTNTKINHKQHFGFRVGKVKFLCKMPQFNLIFISYFLDFYFFVLKFANIQQWF